MKPNGYRVHYPKLTPHGEIRHGIGDKTISGIQASLLDNEIECYTMTSMNINPDESINVRIIFRSALDKKPITDAS